MIAVTVCPDISIYSETLSSSLALSSMGLKDGHPKQTNFVFLAGLLPSPQHPLEGKFNLLSILGDHHVRSHSKNTLQKSWEVYDNLVDALG